MADGTRKPVEVQGAEQSWGELVKMWNEVIETKNLTDTKPSLPKMVFSIIGDSDSFVPKPWPKSKFQSALITAAKNAGDSLLFYGGRKTGISRVVYQALKDRYRLDFFDDEGKQEVPLSNCVRPEVDDKKQKQGASSPLIQLLGIMHQGDRQTTNSEENDFEETVSQMIYTGNSNDYNNFLVKLEATVSKQRTEYSEVNLSLKMPVLIILLEGDKDAIKHVKMAVERNLPVVIVQGTGKAADLIVDCFESDDIVKTLKRRAPLLFGESFNNKILRELKEYIDVINEHQWLIHIFNLNADDPDKLSQIAGEAVICGWSMSNIEHPIEDDGTQDTKPQQNQDRQSRLSQEKSGTSGAGKSATFRDSRTLEDEELYKLVNEVLPPAVCDPSVTPKTRNGGNGGTGQANTVTNAISHGIQSQNKERKEEERRYVLNAKFMSPSSLPLHFYFQYQTLQADETLFKDKEIKHTGAFLKIALDNFMKLHIKNLHRPKVYRNLKPRSYRKGQGHGKIFNVSAKYRELLLEALKTNRIDYIQVLLDDDVTIDADQLKQLYSTTVKCESCDFNEDEDKCLHMQWIMKQENSELAEEIIGKKANPKKIRKKAEKLCRKMLGYSKGEKEDTVEQQEKKQKGQGYQKYFGRNLTIHYIMLKHASSETAPPPSSVCRDTNVGRCSELVKHVSGIYCTVLLKHLSSEASDAKEFQFSEELLNHAKIFEKRSLLLMDKLYEFDTKTTLKIVGDASTVWNITSEPMRFAHENKLYEIVAHTGCQKALNRKWYNKLPPDWLALLKPTWGLKCQFLRSPIMRFLIYYIMFVLMLISYSSYVMTSIDDNNYERVIARLWEYYTYFWAFGDLIEEGKRLFQGVSTCTTCTTGNISTKRFWKRLWHYIKDFWNLIDLLSYVLLIIALFVRHFTKTEEYNIPRRLFSLSLLVMYLRFLQIFFISHRLGTQLLMIKEMLKDLIDFLYVMVIIILAVGIYYHANLFPNHLAIFGPGTIETWSFWKVFYYPYWQLYGETFNEYLDGKDLSNCISNMTIYNLDPSQERCPREEFSVPVVSAFYFLISNLLLVNLVIAKFSYTFDAVQTNSVKLWKFQRYSLVTEYESKIPSPFNLFFYLCPFYYIYKCRNSKRKCCLDFEEKREAIQAFLNA